MKRVRWNFSKFFCPIPFFSHFPSFSLLYAVFMYTHYRRLCYCGPESSSSSFVIQSLSLYMLREKCYVRDLMTKMCLYTASSDKWMVSYSYWVYLTFPLPVSLRSLSTLRSLSRERFPRFSLLPPFTQPSHLNPSSTR